MLKLKGTQ
jgi:hypothetical protein